MSYVAFTKIINPSPFCSRVWYNLLCQKLPTYSLGLSWIIPSKAKVGQCVTTTWKTMKVVGGLFLGSIAFKKPFWKQSSHSTEDDWLAQKERKDDFPLNLLSVIFETSNLESDEMKFLEKIVRPPLSKQHNSQSRCPVWPRQDSSAGGGLYHKILRICSLRSSNKVAFQIGVKWVLMYR